MKGDGSKKGIQPIENAQFQKSDFYKAPDSTASNLILDILGAGADIADLPERKKQINHNTEYEVMEDGAKRLITLKSNNKATKIIIELSNIGKVAGSNKPAKKLFVLSLIKANEQAIHNGQLTREYITFPLQELVDIGFYKTLRSARNGFNSGADALTSLKIKGSVKKSKKKGADIAALEVLFTGARIIKGQCYIFLNPRIDWGFLAQYFTTLPRYYFKLPNRASDLLYYIFYLARQRTKAIEQQGYFTIGFRAIQHKLQLPNEKRLNNPQRDIKDVIENTIEQISSEHNNCYGGTGFSLTPVCDEKAPIAEYLDNGYLKVKLTGDFASGFIAINEKREKKIGKYLKSQNGIQERASKKSISPSPSAPAKADAYPLP